MDFDSNDPDIAEQIPINQALVEELIAFIPDSWRAAELRLEWLPDSKGVSQLVVCPDTGEGWTVSHDMMQAVLELDQHRKKYRMNWRSAVYGVRLDANDMWQATANFSVE